jgi:hypothetical protein
VQAAALPPTDAIAMTSTPPVETVPRAQLLALVFGAAVTLTLRRRTDRGTAAAARRD